MTNATNTPISPTSADRIHVGVSPAGVEWNVYRREGESGSDFQARANVQEFTLARHWKRYEEKRAADKDSEIIRIRKLSPNAVYAIADHRNLMEGLQFPHYVEGKTFVEMTREAWAGVRDRIDPVEAGEMASMSLGCETDAQIEFATRAAVRAAKLLRNKIRLALGETGVPHHVKF